MNITILCSDLTHPVNTYLTAWKDAVSQRHNVEIVRNRDELTSGDFLFLVSCSEIINAEHRTNYRHTLLLHASDLPRGRGWSPHIWEIIQGAPKITVSLLEAEDRVDTGRIWLKEQITPNKTALWNEINHLLFKVEIKLINKAIELEDKINPQNQDTNVQATYYRKRSQADSKIDPELNISKQFDLLRMCDPNRYPAWFEFRGQKYKLVIEKMNDE